MPNIRCTLDPESLNIILLKRIRGYLLETLNLLSGGEIYQLPYDDIKIFFKNHSRAARKKGRASQAVASSYSSNTSNMLEEFKSEMLQTLTLQIDTMQIKWKQGEVERSLAIFCPRCIRRYPRNECPLNLIEICSVCEENQSTNKYPSLPGLKVVYQGTKGVTKQLCYINQRRPHGPRPYQQVMQGSSYSYYNHNQNTFVPPW